MNERRTIQIWHENLAGLRGSERLPLLSLEKAEGMDDELHIHGGLRIRIGERLVPYLGYFGPDDVCFNDWVEELGSVARAFESVHGRHVFDEGEQGQPAFVFERDGDQAFLTIAPRKSATGKATLTGSVLHFRRWSFWSSTPGFVSCSSRRFVKPHLLRGKREFGNMGREIRPQASNA